MSEKMIETNPIDRLPGPPLTQRSELRRCARSMGALLLVFAILYAGFYAVRARFPYVETGAALVKQGKRELARTGNPFADAPPGSIKVMTFGHSKMLSGFIPSLFDRLMSEAGVPSVYSYNFGLPGDSRFVADLEVMAERGVAPDVALFMVPWPEADEPGPTFFHFIRNEREIMDQLFPFRHLPRDTAIMAIEGRGSPKGFARVYAEAKRIVNQVQVDRGYYFIARQSHFPNDELPDVFRSPGDTPNVPYERVIPGGPVRDRLLARLAAHKVRCIFVPSYFREGEFAAPPPKNLGSVAALGGRDGVELLGPDYWRYPNKLFSDPTHVNPRGAEAYTLGLSELVAPWFKQQGLQKN